MKFNKKLIAGVALSVVLFGSTDAPTMASSSGSGQPKGFYLPVVKLPTVYGYTPPKLSVPRTIEFGAPKSLAGQLEWYAFGNNVFLGPAGWRLKGKALIGMDGSGGATLYNPSAPSEQMSVFTSGGCYGCSLDQAAEFWPGLAKDVPSNWRTAAESGFRVFSVTSHLKTFTQTRKDGLVIDGIVYADLVHHMSRTLGNGTVYEMMVVMPPRKKAVANVLISVFSDGLGQFYNPNLIVW